MLIRILISFILSSAAFAKNQPSVKLGKQKSETCIACHTETGNSIIEAQPKISNQPIKYFVRQLKEFKKPEDKSLRYNPTMYEIAKELSEKDMLDLAAYFATFEMTKGKADSGLVDLGRRVYKGGNSKTGVPACSGCHGPQGMSNEPGGIPHLSGQYAEYIKTQLIAYKEGERNTMPQVMQGVAQKMSTEEIEAVSEYIQGLR